MDLVKEEEEGEREREGEEERREREEERNDMKLGCEVEELVGEWGGGIGSYFILYTLGV